MRRFIKTVAPQFKADRVTEYVIQRNTCCYLVTARECVCVCVEDRETLLRHHRRMTGAMM